MDDLFKIFIEQLRDGHEERIDERFDPDFLEVSEVDLAFNQPVNLQGTASLAENELILHWNIDTCATIPCLICNEPVGVPIEITDFYYSEPIEEIKSGVYNFKSLLRETLLLEVPQFAECNSGKCKKRNEFQKYLKAPSDLSEEEGYQPFADFDWK